MMGKDEELLAEEGGVLPRLMHNVGSTSIYLAILISRGNVNSTITRASAELHKPLVITWCLEGELV